MSDTSSLLSPHEQRRRIRQERRALPESSRRRKSLAITKKIIANPKFIAAKHVGLYLSDKGEVDTQFLIQACFALNKKVYLPVLDRFRSNEMVFIEYQTDDKLISNKFNMPEPAMSIRKRIPARCLSLVLCPLVGFDKDCARLGMGGGYYDRHFEFKTKKGASWRPPYLLGLAFELQKLPPIETQAWDVRLNSVTTELHTYFARKN
ncbi:MULTISPECIES: 5-formyltetrahydrofolate cyclo-ligase [unclassified Oleiphilus]|uniref:5-formyltetrahydrofolate cyclo-ligase n=1 Tax=unclassified Oleiphilus TaxID=2631174 RepID=UPI0007C29C2E|nr:MULTISPECIES: 5-formyltetrahydrofolate cyclo-ligase [unclassified Oleiphilus]KZY65288.1 hypothetical protein A3738_00900 [Oleiphilus sp. HI0066]KZY68492.1 hypothetical protein A3739_01605 [Oleiphilus sp. HI0067]KZY70587.1 hypothetical protein A3739_17670 [Oleiphilus sp. HI0067]